MAPVFLTLILLSAVALVVSRVVRRESIDRMRGRPAQRNLVPWLVLAVLLIVGIGLVLNGAF